MFLHLQKMISLRGVGELVWSKVRNSTFPGLLGFWGKVQPISASPMRTPVNHPPFVAIPFKTKAVMQNPNFTAGCT